MKLISSLPLLVFFVLAACHSKCPAPAPIQNAFAMEVILGPETNSAFLDENNPTTSYTSYPDISVGLWTHGGGFVKNRFAIAPDLSSIPKTAIIDSAFIIFQGTDNATSANVSGGQYNNYGDNAFYLERISYPWNNQTATWDNQPITTDTNRVDVPNVGDGNGGSGKISILSMIQDMVARPYRGYGILIKFQDEITENYRRILFASNNHSEVALRPALKIYYHK